jgi:Tfp pilus tip-associated adhesin PilY1
MDWTPRSIWAETRTSIKTYVDGVLKRSCTDSGVSAASSAALFTGGGGTAGTLADFDDAFVC